MSLDVETVLERRRMRRQVGLWRGLAILAGVLVLIAFALMRANEAGLLGNQQIARVTIDGMITEDRKQLKMLKKIAKSDNVKGVVLFINSPGGTTTGGEGLFKELRDLASKKPVVAQFGTLAASAAYIAGLGADHIVARGNSITGSVGVIMQWPEVSGLLDKIGVKFNSIKSGSLKAEPSPFEPANEEALTVAKGMIEESQRWFVGLVEERRGINAADVPDLLKGRVYSGREALKHKLIDAIGGEDEAVDWMVKQRGVTEGLRVVDWKPEDDLNLPFRSSGAWILAIFGFEPEQVARAVWPTAGLDGLLSVWHPQEN